jgi:hypothetical protein
MRFTGSGFRLGFRGICLLVRQATTGLGEMRDTSARPKHNKRVFYFLGGRKSVLISELCLSYMESVCDVL